MIISASRRTDIPCYYSEWFINRLKEGYALIPNPWNADRLSRVVLSPANVDCIVFWTKNPQPMMSSLTEIDAMGYPYYFEFTVTPYGKELERYLPEKRIIIETFKRLSDRLGPKRVDWRFDPVIISDRSTKEWIEEQFGILCRELHGYTERCIMSFADDYSRGKDRYSLFSENGMREIAGEIAKIAEEYHLPVFSCSEEIDLSCFGIRPSSCIDQKKIEQIIGCPISAQKDKGQRPGCGCIESVDIGAYDTCGNGCTYCYATKSEKSVLKRRQSHDPKLPILTGLPKGTETITDRTKPSQKNNQMSLF